MATTDAVIGEPAAPARVAEVCRALWADVEAAALEIPLRPDRYATGDTLSVTVQGVWPPLTGRATFRIEAFAGGGFAGQVYRCRLVALDALPPPAGLCVGGMYGVKILAPPSWAARRFRDAIHRLGFGVPFSARYLEAACRAGLLWQTAIRAAAGREFGRADAVAAVYGMFFDPGQAAFGEVREWIEGRMWRLETDARLGRRRAWRTIDPRDSGSPEYIAKRQFMARFVDLLHRVGAPELARQYVWYTLKSQTNVLKRQGSDDDPAAGLCAFDFRAGLALLPFLPMSPADVRLIAAGIRRGAWVQFDRGDIARLRAYAAEADGAIELGLIDALAAAERAYRRAMPDLAHQGWRLWRDAALRADVRRGMVAGYRADELADEAFAERLARGGGRFGGFLVLGLVPLAGRPLRRLWGHAGYRRHVRRWWTNAAYRRAALGAVVARMLAAWLRAGRVAVPRAQRLRRRPAAAWIEGMTLGRLPRGVHRGLTDPMHVLRRLAAGGRFVVAFVRRGAFREAWLAGEVNAGYAEGMLSERERDEILARIGDPAIARYLASLGVHFATLPLTQVVSLLTAGVVLAWHLAHGTAWGIAAAYAVGILALFQVIPVSPGSLARGAYVIYLMIRERNVRGYLVAAPLSFVKYIGYLAFPIQMAAAYPALARFMSSRWAIRAVGIVPVFGERGALLEHVIFDAFFNLPRAVGARLSRHGGWALTVWMALGTGLFGWLTHWIAFETRGLVNLLIAVVVVFVLPRVLFYPVLRAPPRHSREVQHAG